MEQQPQTPLPPPDDQQQPPDAPSNPPAPVPYPPLDRLTQVQDVIDRTTAIFTSAVGLIQAQAPPMPVDPTLPVVYEKASDLTQAVSRDLVFHAKVFDALVDKLPAITVSEEEQISRLQQLEEENHKVGLQLEKTVAMAEAFLEEIRSTMRIIANDQHDFYRRD
ncbi:Mediator of RNA polymerase II transcription subunit 21 [Borealophlyctis nickersoniae]|nr:Mediator of RNA polymerase II transcription subunit 21 [Borealophlyctis nickersoniae]